MSIFSKATKLIKELAMEAKHRAIATPLYVEFEPPCDWLKNNGSETLVLYLPEFKKEELKVEISNMKNLSISGERYIDETKRSRFCKRITVPGDCNAKEIRAKFVNGLLQIKMPKINSFYDFKQEQIPKIEENSHLASPKTEDKISQNQGNALPTSSNKKGSAETKLQMPRNLRNIASKNEETQSFARLRNFSKVAMSVVVVTVVVAGLGALIVYACLFLLA